MTAPIVEPVPTSPAAPLAPAAEPAHEHARTCYWDLRECRWSCAAPAVGK